MFIVDEQHTQTVERAQFRRLNLTARHGGDRRGAIRQQRERGGKLRALPGAVTVRRDSAAVKFDQMTNDREAETQATKTARRRTVCLAKTIENARQKLGRDSLTRVAHGDRRVRAVAFDAEGGVVPARGCG